jgi:hypothetical protein
MKTLTRDEFREEVFERDNFKCVVCGSEAQDAHHILERRLWGDGGYHLDNGASLCGDCHIKAETTEYSCELIREKAGITTALIPEDFYSDHKYSKWGDVILPNGNRMKGPLFFDESVQKILKKGGMLNCYTDYIKYPRTFHLPWSEGINKDDRALKDCSIFKNKNVVVTEKLDGENTSIYSDYLHARSIDGRNHWSRSWVKNLHSQIKHEIPNGWRICGENLFAKHSISYDNLKSFFYVFSIWDENNNCLSWKETREYASMLGLECVPVIYEGKWDEEKIKSIELDLSNQEGYVVRYSGNFNYCDFKNNIAKFVRKGHVQTKHNWMYSSCEKNSLIS